MKFFNPYEEIRVTSNKLPHWQQPGACYFVTFRLADSVPVKLISEWNAERQRWRQQHPPPHTPELEAEYHRLFSARMDRWMDEGHGACHLRETRTREAVKESFDYFDGQRYELLSYVIMPNHIHSLLILHPEGALEKVLFTWKRRTSGVINSMLGLRGAFWQEDYFDRLIRDGDHLRNVIRYIRRNPQKAQLQPHEYTLWEGDFARTVT